MTVKAAVYTRISNDRESNERGVERQEQDCRARAAREGFEVVDVYIDNDVSASTKTKKPRPRFQQMMSDARAQKFDVILAYSNSRLTRRPRELEDLIDHHAQYKTRFLTIVSGDDDLSTANGRRNARIKGSIDAGEAEETADRVRRAKRQAAEDGRYRGGPRPYGYEKGGVTLREDEAQVIRDATKAILSGRSLRGIAHELNEQGRKTSTGKPWTYMRLRDVLVRPRNAGMIHQGRADRRHESRENQPMRFEIVGKAQWPAIVDYDTWNACATMLLDPSRRIHTSTEPRWLGSRSYVCGRPDCGALMRPTSKVDHVPDCPVRGEVRKCACSRLYHYRCSEQNHLSIAAYKTDDWVRRAVAQKVRHPRVIEALLGHDSESATRADRERRSTLVASLEQTDRDYDMDVINAKRHKSKTSRLNDEIMEIDVRLAEAAKQSTVSPIFTAADPGQAFLDAPVDVQRAVLRSVLTVTVLPVAKRGDKWSDERLVLDPVIPT